MASASAPRRLRLGDRAPDFTLPAADRDGVVSLADYRGDRPVLLAIFRGLYCPFCRRQMARLATSAETLEPLGAATLGVVATAADRARVYFRFRPPRFPIGADPELGTHRTYGLQQQPKTPETARLVEAAAAEMARDLGISAEPGRASDAILRFDGFEFVESDWQDAARDQALVIGQFLVDREGLVRWMHIERQPGELPSDEQLVSVVKAL